MMLLSLRLACATGLGVAVLWPLSAGAADNSPSGKIAALEEAVRRLQEENRSLRQRIEEIERRTNNQQGVTNNTPSSEGKGSWRKLRKGMTRDEVESLLGPPQRITVRTQLTFWTYPSASSATLPGEVTFQNSDMTLNEWQEP